MVDTQAVVRILDFGIARLEGSGMTMDGSLIGTLNYMSPEQLLGRQVDHRSDIFAVGAVAHELLSYCQAFPGTLEELIQRLPNEPAAPLRTLCPGVDPGIEDVLARALEKQPDRRFDDLAQMQRAFAAARERVLAERGPNFVLSTPAATVALAATLRRGPTTSGLADDDLRSELQAASKCLESGDAARAADLAQRVIDRAPSSVEAHAILIRARRAMVGLDLSSNHQPRIEPVRRNRRRNAVLAAWAAAGLAAAATAAVLTGVFPGGTSTLVEPTPPPVVVDRPPEALSSIPAEPPAVAPPDPAPVVPEGLELEALARESIRRLERARVLAIGANARELASQPFNAASALAEVAQRAYDRRDYAEVVDAGATAARRFTEALTAAETEAERRRVAAAMNVPVEAPAIVASQPIEAESASVAPADLKTDPAPFVPTLAAVSPAPTLENAVAAAPVNAMVRERPAILAALEQYRAAYQNRNIDALKAVYPTLAGEQLQARERAFKDKRGCRALDVRFGDPVVSLTADATVAHVNVMSTYVCTPVTGQAKPQEPLPDLFQMRKQGDSWVIAVMGAMARQ
jgi:hypothetical protein